MKRAKTSKFEFEFIYVKQFLFNGTYNSAELDSNSKNCCLF